MKAMGSRRARAAAVAAGVVAALVPAVMAAPAAVATPATWTPTWTNVEASGSTGAPPPAQGSVMAYDASTNQTLLVGGYASAPGGGFASIPGTWGWNGSSWSSLNSSSPSARSFVQMAYDGATGQMVLFGGQGGAGNSSFFGGTYLWGGTAWTKVLSASATDTSTTPSERAFGAMAYDPASKQLILFGGQNGPNADGGTWVWNGTTRTWSNLNLSAPSAPQARFGASMAYDPQLKELILFGGFDAGASLDTTWAWNGASWSKITTATTPPARYGATMVYNPALGELELYGGADSTTFYGDNWVFDSATQDWSQLTVAASVPPRFAAARAYDPASQQDLLFGGASSSTPTLQGGTWSLETAPGTPAAPSASPGDGVAHVNWIAPPDGGTNITSYTVTPTPACAGCGGLTVTGNPAATGTTVTGLSNGTSYTFSVTATNSIGTSGASPASAPVTPAVPTYVPPPAPQATTTTFTSGGVSPAEPVSGQPATYTATVRPSGTGTATPTGTVTFDAAAQGSASPTAVCSAPLASSGQASCRGALPASGSPYSVTASYSGDSNFAASTSSPAVSVTVTQPAPAATTKGGYWEAASDGGVFAFGDAGFYGSMGGTHLNSPVVGIAPTPDGRGYWLVGADGGVFAFGDAGFYGSMGGTHLSAPVRGIAATPDGHGYWLVGADGGVFAFGDAGFYGSPAGTHPASPVTGIAPSADGRGYRLAEADGTVLNFGDAASHGSLSGQQLAAPVVGVTTVPGGGGYWEVASDGGIFAFGSAPFDGSMGGHPLNRPVVAMAPAGS